MIELFDTHCHLQEPEFADDVDAVARTAFEAGVTMMVMPGEDVTSSQRAADLAERLGVYAAAGFHPHAASGFNSEGLAGIEHLLAHPRVVAVGEIGLDFFRQHSEPDDQVRTFEAHLELAARHALPVIVHAREAWQALSESLDPWARRVSQSYEGRPLGVLHYYSSDVETARHYAGLGFMISVHTSVTHPRANQLREVAAALPLNAMVVETDSPYGAPQAYRGKRNQPAYVLEAVKQIADLRGVSVEAVAEATTANARRLFGLEPGGTRIMRQSTGAVR